MKRLALAVFATGCMRAMPPVATVHDADRGRVELADLERGRSLLIQKCSGSCHRAPMPLDHTAAEWPISLAEMSQRAGLSDQQRILIERYLVTMASNHPRTP